ncbi:uncharacterized protein ACBT57_025141 isoform 1-T1 [Dama dama]
MTLGGCSDATFTCPAAGPRAWCEEKEKHALKENRASWKFDLQDFRSSSTGADPTAEKDGDGPEQRGRSASACSISSSSIPGHTPCQGDRCQHTLRRRDRCSSQPALTSVEGCFYKRTPFQDDSRRCRRRREKQVQKCI